jgi:pilus assembly protein TadC
MHTAMNAAGSADTSITGWVIGYTVAIVVVVVVVALVGTIIVLARSIGREAALIDDSLHDSVRHTAALAQLSTTIQHAEVIVDGLARGRARLGG